MEGIATYQAMGVLTQTPGQLIVMLYDGAIKALRQAIVAIEAKDYTRKSQCFGKAIAILHELNVSLDMDAGGEIADDLRRLYLFMIRQLNEASIQLNTTQTEQVVSLLNELNSAWKQIAS
jgi:flagellar protein FliS